MEHFPSDSEPETRIQHSEAVLDFPKRVLPIVIFTGKLSAELSTQTTKVCKSQALINYFWKLRP